VSARRLESKPLVEAQRRVLRERVIRLRERDTVPRLCVLLTHDDASALSYLQAKQRRANDLGIELVVVTLDRPTTEDAVSWLNRWDQDSAVSGVLVESPVASGIDLSAVRRAIPSNKDVDGFGIQALGRLMTGEKAYPPATAAAALQLAECEGAVSGKHAVVLGRSLVVGRPLALLLLSRDATVTVCHSKTEDLSGITREADLLFVAIGRAGTITGDMVKPGAVVIDIGTNVVSDKIVGDVDAASVDPVAGALSPVPGGVGPLTTLSLLEHVVDAAERLSG
jgi:methylenetetrahydrofolate dehydrogenase (NADP+) / methenyltetrahydrofolate cyclohydrolase